MSVPITAPLIIMETMTTKREANRVRTYVKILDATRSLVKETGATDFSMPELAKAAGVALVTPYKHFDSKVSILEALLNQCLVEIQGVREKDEIDGIDPLGRIIHGAVNGAKMFVEGEDIQRALLIGIRKLSGDGPINLSIFKMWVPLWEIGIDEAVAVGDIHKFVDAKLLARSLHILWSGAQLKWVSGESSSEQFLADVRYGVSVILLAVVTDVAEPQMRHRFSQAERELHASLSCET